jgi:hypothetical protein
MEPTIPKYRPALLSRAVRPLTIVALVTLSACSPSSQSGADSESRVEAKYGVEAENGVGAESAVEYGTVPSPPLPQARPVAALSDDNAVADHDGSVVVTLIGAPTGPGGPDSSVGPTAPVLRFVAAEPGRASAVERASTVERKSAVERTSAVVATEVGLDVGPGAELRAVSADGSRAAVYESVEGQGGPMSRLTVVDRSAESRSEPGVPLVSTFELPGLVEPEAFSTDGGRLFVIDHTVSTEPGAYRVRPFDLETGRLREILGPTKVPFTDVMNGVGRRQVWSPRGDRLYTLYIRQTHHHHHGSQLLDDDHSAEHGHPEPGTDGFVHVLDLAEEWAFCLDLPPAFGGGDLATTALAVSPDGLTVAVADLSAGQVAFASTDDLEVTGTMTLPAVGELGELHIGLADRSTMFAASGSTGRWFDISTVASLGDGPVELGRAPRAVTSFAGGVLVWPDGLGDPPRELHPPGHR